MGFHRSPKESHQKGPIMNHWCFLWCKLESAVEQTFHLPVIWEDIALTDVTNWGFLCQVITKPNDEDFTRLISSSKGSALTVWYKTKVGSHNFGYQLWFCTRLVTVDWGSAVTMTLCSSWCHWYILCKDMSINSKYQEANIIVQNALPTTNRYEQYLYKQDDLYILRQPA